MYIPKGLTNRTVFLLKLAYHTNHGAFDSACEYGVVSAGRRAM